jgi:ABC-type multidrug transport system fused ATPase/permease subunit
LISTLLRLLDLESGIIFIDGVDISTIPRQVVRQQINTVSQEPFFLHGTVRENIDPFDTATDERIAEVLHDMGMWELFEARGGLDGDMNDETLSHGQRQLFCLGRAVIRSGRIVVMDEAMSSVDADTEQLMQRIIDSEFRGRTILAIVHKLHTILDFDRVILLDKGTVVETGNPRELLARENSAFQTLYNKMRDAAE